MSDDMKKACERHMESREKMWGLARLVYRGYILGRILIGALHEMAFGRRTISFINLRHAVRYNCLPRAPLRFQ